MTSTELVKPKEKSLPAEVKKECENCGASLSGQFCAECGQEITSNIRYFGTVILHLLDDIFSFDSRASRTLLPLVLKPGFLTQKYFAGKRVHYVPPLRLYLFISIIFFLSLKLFTDIPAPKLPISASTEIQQSINDTINELNLEPTSSKNEEVKQRLNEYVTDIQQKSSPLLQSNSVKLAQLELKKLTKPDEFSSDDEIDYKSYQQSIADYKKDLKAGKKSSSYIRVSNQEDGTLRFDFLSAEMNKKLNEQVDILKEKAETAITSDPSKLIEEAIGKMPQLMFILLPIFALLLKIFYLFSKRLYMEHLTVALHSHSFIFFIILLIEMLNELEGVVIESFPTAADMLNTLMVGLLIWIPVYLFLMQKRVYKQGMLMTVIKFNIIAISYLMMIIFTGLAALVWGLTSI
ncbi:DUF3667 domain-containing protein [Litorilituus lipolyticus]|uniref:DUF3667 domain-containing protein n=1 Tax=Litorilituus lipolyticus TaxID=2491017 RepID=A0A502KX52_9GAMM|nr:DUF3667 domain-containing protein [Litorilituus lipolyticus]TPH16202.1 DUF3667 domain-containing protein [Litorilituus lipolyticus]